MDKDKDTATRHNHNNNTNSSARERAGGGGGGDGSLPLRACSDAVRQTTSSDFVLQWGNRKRLRCMKVQVKEKDKDDSTAPIHRTTVRVDRRVVRADKDSSNQPSTTTNGGGYLNLRQRPSSPQPPPSHRVLRSCVDLFGCQICDLICDWICAREGFRLETTGVAIFGLNVSARLISLHSPLSTLHLLRWALIVVQKESSGLMDFFFAYAFLSSKVWGGKLYVFAQLSRTLKFAIYCVIVWIVDYLFLSSCFSLGILIQELVYVLIAVVVIVSRNSETSSAMRGQSNGAVRGIASPDRGAHDKKGTNNGNHHNPHHHNHHHHHHHHHHQHNENNNKSAASSETAHDSKKGGSSSGSGELAAPPVWPPRFVIALTNKEKEEDFYAFKGSKLPQRPKKRAKLIQRTLNLVSPGAWLCDLTLERYEVREKKISKKVPDLVNFYMLIDAETERPKGNGKHGVGF
ncbi:hypothetical protein TIFTF001_005651 [Ficus carica]|uniref:Uncharacterized protein n=1 Tax=Ficus carica TaxID=3494 RepID=A0AA88CYW0_FICCA|nr:hypothetical protein TIFTF001_005651 [Ficus carica]